VCDLETSKLGAPYI